VKRHLFCGRNLETVGLFLEETGWVGAGFISVCLATRWLGQKPWFRCAGSTL